MECKGTLGTWPNGRLSPQTAIVRIRSNCLMLLRHIDRDQNVTGVFPLKPQGTPTVTNRKTTPTRCQQGVPSVRCAAGRSQLNDCYFLT